MPQSAASQRSAPGPHVFPHSNLKRKQKVFSQPAERSMKGSPKIHTNHLCYFNVYTYFCCEMMFKKSKKDCYDSHIYNGFLLVRTPTKTRTNKPEKKTLSSQLTCTFRSSDNVWSKRSSARCARSASSYRRQRADVFSLEMFLVHVWGLKMFWV